MLIPKIYKTMEPARKKGLSDAKTENCVWLRRSHQASRAVRLSKDDIYSYSNFVCRFGIG
jgi:hypothetical protein